MNSAIRPLSGFHIAGQSRLPTIWRSASIWYLAFGVVAFLSLDFMKDDNWLVLGVLCSLGLAYSVWVINREFRDGPRRFLTDPFLIFVGSFAVYFLFGPLLLVWGPDDQANYALSWYPTTASDAVRVTAMNFIGLGVVLLSASFLKGKNIENVIMPAILLFRRWPLVKVFIVFSVIGVFFKIITVRADLLNSDDGVVLGTFRTLTGLLQMAILIGVLYRGRGERLIRACALVMAGLDSFLGLLLLSKSAFLMPILVVLLGQYFREPSRRRIIFSLVFLVGVLFMVVGPVGDGRILLFSRDDQSLQDRTEILKEVLIEESPLATQERPGGVWSRLCYVGAQVAAVNLYNSGEGDDDITLIGWVFVPRAIVSEKPIITQSGPKFNKKITGSDRSSTGMGLFVNGFYNLGWLGLFSVSILTSVMLVVYSAFSRAVINAGSIVMLPISQLGNFMAFRIDGHFVADYLGAFVQVMLPLLIFVLLIRLNIIRSN